MLVADLLRSDFPLPLSTDTIGQVLGWMDEYHCTQLPVLSKEGWEGLVCEEDLQSYPEDFLLHQVGFVWREAPSLSLDQSIWSILPLFSQWSALPVLQDNQVVGVVTDHIVFRALGDLMHAQDPGAVLEIQIKNRDYSLAEISRLIESNRVKVLASSVSGTSADPENPLVLWIKLDQTEISAVVATLERFGYTVLGAYGHTPVETIDQQRYDLLMKYLNI